MTYDYTPRPYQLAMLENLNLATQAFDVLNVKMRRCADDFRRLGKEWRRLSRPRGKQARRAAFAARQRALRKAR